MHSLLAAWRVSLHRTRADWPIVAAAWLIVVLAATLLAAGPIYSSAVSLAGLHRVLDDADVADANVEITARVVPEEAAPTLEKVTAAVRQALAEIGVEVVSAGGSDSFALPDQASEEVRDLTTLGFLEGVDVHATLISGAWPVTDGDGPVQVAILDQIADTLGAAVGDRLPLVSRLDASQVLDVIVVGVYRPTDPNDSFWWSDQTLLEGVVESAQYRTFGPMLTTREELFGRVSGQTVPLTWHAFPHFDQLTIEQVGPLDSELRQLPDSLSAADSPRSAPILARSSPLRSDPSW